MLRIIIFSTFLFYSLLSNSQEVKILDYDTDLPIENCVVYGDINTISIYSNSGGIADLSVFNTNEVVSFNHISYIEFEILKRQLMESNDTIFLHKKAESLDEVVLSVNRQKESLSRIAEHVEINRKEDIKKIAPQTSADLLANLSGIKVQKTQSGGGSPVIRGMEANRILLVVDGVRLNNAIYRSGHLQSSITVSPSILERTEIIFGPSSVMYGSDALGGVIHYYTKTPRLSEEMDSNIEFMSRYSTVNDEFANQASVELSFKKWASLTSFSYAKFGDIRLGERRSHGFKNWGKVFEYSNNTNSYYNPNPVKNDDPNIQKNTEYSQSDFLQKFYFQLTEKTNLTVNFQHSKSSDIPRFDKLTEKSNGTLKFAEWYYGPQERILLSTQISLNAEKSWLNSGIITAAFQNIKESRVNRKFNSLDRSYRNENVDVLNLNGDFSVPLSKNSNRNLSYGFEFAHNEVDSESKGKTIAVVGNEIVGFSNEFNIQSRYPDGGSSYTSSALYLNYRQDINEKSTLNTGVRFTGTYLKAKWIDESFITLPDNDISVMNSALTATIGYVYKPTDLWQLNSLLSSGFRSPNIDDVGKIREKNGQVTVPNVDLKPEYAYNIEFGALKYLKDKKFNFGLNLYYTLLNKYIARTPFLVNGSPTVIYDDEELDAYANVNHGNAYIIGTTFSFNGKISNEFSTSGSLTLTKGKGYDSNLPLSSIPPIFGNLEVNYVKNKLETALNFRFNGEKKLEDYNLIEGIDNIQQTPIDENTGEYYGTPAWSTLNIYSRYNFTQNIAIQFIVNNIFDNHYKEFASAISAPGRNFSFSIHINN